MSVSEIVNKVWNYGHVLRDDSVSYGDYAEDAPDVLPPVELEHPCSSQLPINEVPHECV